MATFPFFRLPRELRDLIYESACKDSHVAKDSLRNSLKGVHQAFLANKALWLEYEEICLKHAMLHYRIPADYSDGPPHTMRLSLPNVTEEPLVLLVDLKLPSERGWVENPPVDVRVWKGLLQRLKKYPKTTAVAIEIFPFYADGRRICHKTRDKLWHSATYYLCHVWPLSRQPALQQLFLRIDKTCMIWWQALMPSRTVTSWLETPAEYKYWSGELSDPGHCVSPVYAEEVVDFMQRTSLSLHGRKLDGYRPLRQSKNAKVCAVLRTKWVDLVKKTVSKVLHRGRSGQ